jgi:hypothetical protein
MAIVGTELKYYQSKVVNDTTSNGGRISTTLITSGQSNTWWPNVTEAQLASGVTQYRKGFMRVDNANDDVGYNCRIGLWKPTPGSDALYLIKGTHTDTQNTVGSTLYGAGTLDSSVLTGVSEIDVLVEDGTVTIFRAGDLIRISDQTTVGGSGNAEIKEIDIGGVSVDGDVVTLTLTSALANDYSDTNTYVCSLIEEATVTGTTTGKVVTSVAGTFDATEMTVGNLGSIYQVVTFTFTSATAFTVTSDEVTFSPNTGSISATYEPTNVVAGASYFSVPPACWGGTFANGNTVVITTIPPCVPIWEKRVVPVGATAIASQTRTLMTFIES